MSAVTGKVLPVFLTLFIGWFCGRRRIISESGTRTLKDVVVNITLPAVLAGAFAETDFTPANLKISLTVFLACLAALAIGAALCRALKAGGKLSPYLSSGFEAGMLGYSLFALLYSSAEVPAFAIIDLGQVAFVFTVYRILLSGERSWRGIALNIVRTPVIWGMALGILLSVTGLYAGIKDVFCSVTDFIGAPTSAVILLSIGCDMASARINLKRCLTPVAVRIVSLAAVYALVCLADPLLSLGMHRGALLLMFILPAPYVLPVFATVDEERADVASALSIQTILALALFAVMVVAKG